MAARTSSQSGNWSSTSTWGGAAAPGDGDTASIGAHTVTVDVDVTVGTSPNDATTKVVDRTSASANLVIASGKTLTVKGNIGGVNACTLTLNAGATLIFDASGSGGTPVYTFVNAGGDILICSGTSGSRCAIRSVNSSYTWKLGQATAFNGVTYTDFVRGEFYVTNSALNSTSGTILTNCSWDVCGTASRAAVDITQNDATLNFTFSDNSITNTVHAANSLKINLGTARTGGTRQVCRNATDKQFNNLCRDVILDHNVMGGITCYASPTTTFYRRPRNNFFDNTLNHNGGNGMAMWGSWEGLYVVSSYSSGNPHFIAPNCTNSANETYRRAIFESHAPDLIDTGDCFLLNSTFCSSGNKLTIRNCIALANPDTGVQTGQMVTSYNPPASSLTHKVEIYHTTTNQNKSAVGGVGIRAAFAFAEGATGNADQIAALKSNMVWTTATGNGYIAERVSGTVDGHITATGADYNWRYNIDDGDNGRGYEDRANSPAQDMWAAGNADGGDAAAAGVDNNQQSGDPGFHDSTRCIATWCAARGYGASTYAAGIAALKANPTRVADLINYVFEGFRVTSASARSAHDGASYGAAIYKKPTRSTTNIISRSTALAAAYSTTFDAAA